MIKRPTVFVLGAGASMPYSACLREADADPLLSVGLSAARQLPRSRSRGCRLGGRCRSPGRKVDCPPSSEVPINSPHCPMSASSMSKAGGAQPLLGPPLQGPPVSDSGSGSGSSGAGSRWAVDVCQHLVIMVIRMLVASWVARVVHARAQVGIVEVLVLMMQPEVVPDLLAHDERSPRCCVVARAGRIVGVVHLGIRVV